MAAHDDLNIHFEADNQYVDMIEERIDIAVRMAPATNDNSVSIFPLTEVRQMLVASPHYLRQHDKITDPKDLTKLQMIGISLVKDPLQLDFTNIETGKKTRVKMQSRIQTNNLFLATTLAKEGHGVARIMSLDIQKELANGELVEVISGYQLPSYMLYAVTPRREQQPAKVTRCLEVLTKYFAKV